MLVWSHPPTAPSPSRGIFPTGPFGGRSVASPEERLRSGRLLQKVEDCGCVGGADADARPTAAGTAALLPCCLSGGFGEGVFVLAVADYQDLFSGALADYELEAVRAGIDGDE